MGDDQALKQRYLVRARALSELPEVFRCEAVTLLIREMLACGVRADAEIFQAAYGEPSGQKYWDAHLSEAIPVYFLAFLLSAHVAEDYQKLEYDDFAILCAFRDAAEAGEHWFIGDIALLLAVQNISDRPDGLEKVKVDPLAAVQWLLSKPKRVHLVPESLCRFMQSNQHYIETTKSEGVSATLDVLPSAPWTMIEKEIAAVYDDAQAAGEKPPNVKQLPPIVLRRLEAKGFQASKRLIQNLADASAFKTRRRRPGKTVKSEQREHQK